MADLATARLCTGCGAELAPSLLACPSCHALVHAERLKRLSAEAQAFEAEADWSGALERWRAALDLLPHDTRQYTLITERATDLNRRIEAGPAKPAAATGPWWKRAGTGIVAVVVLALTKGKLLLAGLLKIPTLFSMLAFFGLYWGVFGWKFALGFVIAIYIHEMGHVFELSRYGIKASAPMFIPGLGAFIRIQQHFTDPRMDARIGLAGPLWGLGATVAAYLAGRLGDSPTLMAIAHTSAVLNLFNLLPIWQLDGGRAFHSLNRPQRWLVALALGGCALVSRDGLIVLLPIVAAVRAFGKPATNEPDNGALALYIGIAVALTWMAQVAKVALRFPA